MKTFVLSILMMALLAATLWSQSSTKETSQVIQPAYRALMGYIQNKEQNATIAKTAGGWTLVGLGAGSVLSGTVFWSAGDTLSEDAYGTALAPKVKLWTSVGLVTGGAALAGIGSLILAAPAPDFRTRFSDVLTTSDPALQEQLAVATLKSLAHDGHNHRVVSGWLGILAPVVTVALTAAVNVQNNKPWSENIISINSVQIAGLIGGVAQLFQPSKEELLYEKYQTTIQLIRP